MPAYKGCKAAASFPACTSHFGLEIFNLFWSKDVHLMLVYTQLLNCDSTTTMFVKSNWQHAQSPLLAFSDGWLVGTNFSMWFSWHEFDSKLIACLLPAWFSKYHAFSVVFRLVCRIPHHGNGMLSIVLCTCTHPFYLILLHAVHCTRSCDMYNVLNPQPVLTVTYLFWGAFGAPILFSVLGFSMASCS